MDWNGAMEDDKRMLKRIVALLFAFASLADHVHALPPPVRGVVLWVLRSAETIAREFVMDMAWENGAAVTPALLLIPALHAGDSPADAVRLARSFRALAIQLDRLADGNPGTRRFCITQSAYTAEARQPARTMFGLRQLCLVAPWFPIERRDSS